MNVKGFKNNFLIRVTILTSLIYIIWRSFFTIPFGYGLLSVTAGIILLVVEVLGLFEGFIHFRDTSDMRYPKKPDIKDESLFPHVDVFIATYNEPVELLYKTVNGCLNMDYPDKSKVHIYVCDDSNRQEMKDMASRLNVNYITRTENTHAKAGNLNNALAHSNSPLIATFDADMIPMHDFLMTCVPYFIGEVKFKGNKSEKHNVGFIQLPQSFYNPDLFQYNLFSEERIPNEQDYFYREIQVARNKSNSVIYGGSNTVISRDALNAVGGFYTGVITEDFATGILIQSKGYKCYAIDEVHASGLSPNDLKSLIKQRERWGRGCIQTSRKLNIFFRKGLDFNQKLSYLSSILYWYSGFKRLVYIVSPILYSVFGIIVVKCTAEQILIFWVPMYLFQNILIRRLSNNIRTVKWSNIYETILFPSLLPVIFLESIGISQKKFSVTRKDKAEDDEAYRIKKTIPHAIFAIFSLIGIFNSIKMFIDYYSLVHVVIFFWLIVNFYNIVMSIFFMLGRKVNRDNERHYIETDCEISFKIKEDYKKVKCRTYDISEGGISIMLDFPIYIPYDDELNLSLKTDRYKCEFKGKIVYVDKIKGQWKYAFWIKKINNINYRELLNIIYDREPTLPKKVEKGNGVFNDIRLNIVKRRYKGFALNRKLPRIKIEKEIDTVEEGKVFLVNFNYEYALIRLKNRNRWNKKTEKNNDAAKERLTLIINEKIKLKCRLGKDQNYRNSKEERLYVIENYEELINNSEFNNILSYLM
ncbi:glycosyltransferase [uncultured Clostridium sp.]|uniref:glycosyltransferase n=1 Tax=uncultured Clostridium sp. TaxID=59620 RepID=UPI0025CF2DA7|nr:glycosyltransferase [uncultured Clostridium sp.]